MASPSRPADRSSFHIAIVCALKLEANAADLLFDDIYDEQQYGRATGDVNTYTTGRVGKHAVVLLLLPSMGPLAAASGSANLRSSYPNIKLALLVGVCGGLPQIDGHEAFLGDVVVSTSIFNYDFGRQHFDGKGGGPTTPRLRTLTTGSSRRTTNISTAGIVDIVTPVFSATQLPAYPAPTSVAMSSIRPAGTERTCGLFRLGPRSSWVELLRKRVMRSGEHRDAIARRHGVIAFEMEGAGAWDEVPCIVVKGICDYADSLKSKLWQNFAAASAASVAVAILDRKLRLQDVGTDEDPKDSVRRYLSSEAAGPWLLIVDNADDADLLFGSPDTPSGLADYLPESEDGLVLFTTRSREVAVSVAGSDVVELSEMDPQEAADYLEKLLIRKGLLLDEGESTKLLKELTYLPLAITQAAAYLNTIQVSIAEYLKLLRGTDQNAASLMSREFRDNTRHKGSRNAVATTWLVSFDQIRKSDRAAADLLSFLSCIEPKAIPQSILLRLEVKEQIVHAIGTLCGYAFLTRRGDSQVFDMHSLVHLATRIWIQKEGLKQAVALLEQVVAIQAKTLAEDHPLRLASQHELAIAYQANGQVRQAVALLEQVVAIQAKTLAENHPSRLASQHELASAYRANGQVKQAVALLEQVVAIKAKTLAEDHPTRLASQHELASAYRANGQVKQAVALLEQVVAIRAKTLAENHPDRLASEQWLAYLLENADLG
ncbi:hypothetical protein RB593_009136 [Gaeumannomyces tritici]